MILTRTEWQAWTSPSAHEGHEGARKVTTARNSFATADELAADVVERRLAKFDGITIRYDRTFLDPYGVDEDARTIILPDGLAWRQSHSRINRCWLYLLGGVQLAPEFAPPKPGRPDLRLVIGDVVPPVVRQLW